VTDPNKTDLQPRPGHHYRSRRKGNQTNIWEVAGLWEKSKDLPVTEVPLDFFNQYLDKNFWFAQKNPPNLRNFLKHCIKVAEADLAYPIILDEDGKVLDGIHRLVKAYLMEEKTIKTVRFPVTPPPDRVEFD